MKKKERFVTVTDYWYGNFNGNQVKLYLVYYKTFDGGCTIFRVTGNDDFSVVKYVKNVDCFDEWEIEFDLIPDGKDVEWFYAQGFKVD